MFVTHPMGVNLMLSETLLTKLYLNSSSQPTAANYTLSLNGYVLSLKEVECLAVYALRHTVSGDFSGLPEPVGVVREVLKVRGFNSILKK